MKRYFELSLLHFPYGLDLYAFIYKYDFKNSDRQIQATFIQDPKIQDTYIGVIIPFIGQEARHNLNPTLGAESHQTYFKMSLYLLFPYLQTRKEASDSKTDRNTHQMN